MGEKLATHTQLLSVDRVAVETIVYGKRNTRHDHKRNEETVAIRELGDKEYSCKRSLHNARHHTRHTGEGEGCDRYLPAKAGAANNGNRSTSECTYKEGWGEGTTHTTCCICGSHSYNLKEHNGDKVDDKEPVCIAKRVEEGVVEQRCCLTRHKRAEAVVTLTIEWWEDKD